MKTLILLAVLMLATSAWADDNANPYLHIPLSAGITYGVYYAMHNGAGVEDKWGCYAMGGMLAFMLGTLWEFDETSTHHITQSLKYDAIGIALPAIPIAIFDK